MTRRFAVVAGVGLLIAALSPVASAHMTEGPTPAEQRTLAAGAQAAEKSTGTPDGANPYLALVPDPSAVDYAGWKRHVARQSAARAAEMASAELQAQAMGNGNGKGNGKGGSKKPPPAPIDHSEQEAADEIGGNDTIGTAEVVDGFGTDKKENNRSVITGTFAQTGATSPAVLPPGTEDDGARPLATDTGIAGTGAVTTTGTIGDGPHGSAGTGTGDFDYHRLEADAGMQITADTDTPGSSLDTMLAVWNADGEIVAFNDDDFSGGFSLDSLAEFVTPEAGTYWVMTTGFPALPSDPDDSGSGDGAGSEGDYDLAITVAPVDVDVYAFDLADGDVLGTSGAGGITTVEILDPSGDLVMGSQQNASGIYAPESPLPGGGNAVAEHVADEAGTHYVRVVGDGDYELTVEAYRPGLEKSRPTQVLFLDFDGERVNTGIFDGTGNVDLSPFADFLADWGLGPSDEDALIDVIVATVEENLVADMEASGLNRHYSLEVTNSRDDRDTFGADHVSRIIVGGTIAESGVPTIGIAQSIDPGNFGQEETALVLLDVLSGPSFDDASLNAYITEDSDVVRFVGTAIGNVVSHEAGHFFGDWHVDQFNDVLNIMDQGGNFPLLYGVGDDGVGGTADDPDVDFQEDTFNPNEGFTGTEDTLSRLAETITK